MKNYTTVWEEYYSGSESSATSSSTKTKSTFPSLLSLFFKRMDLKKKLKKIDESYEKTKSLLSESAHLNTLRSNYNDELKIAIKNLNLITGKPCELTQIEIEQKNLYIEKLYDLIDKTILIEKQFSHNVMEIKKNLATR